MAYNKEKLYKQALAIAKEKKCFFIEQLVSFMPCGKVTFYEYFKINSNEMNTIKEILDLNKIEVKSSMYNKWFKSENATLQVALMKLIATDDEAHRLNGTKREVLNTTPEINIHTDSPEASTSLIDKLSNE